MRFLLISALLAVTGTPAPPAELQRDADAVHALGIVGAQARLVSGDGRSHVVTSGVGDLRTGRPVPPDGRFRIASTGKMFTAVVVLQLAGEGRLGLDEPVERRLPGVVRGNGNDGRRITVRQLLQHTSGLHDDIPDQGVLTPAELVARAMAHRPDAEPGAGWGYSNTGYVLLDMIIERVTGRPWYDEVERRIVGPLGLTGTSWPGASPVMPQPHARAYRLAVDVTDQAPADTGSAIVSTTRDVNTFLRALFGGRLLRAAQLAEMTRTVPVDSPIMPGARYGLGVFRRPLPCGGVYWGHPGGWGGYITDNGVTADGRRSVVLSVNSVLGDAPDDYVRQQRAADTLVEGALCGPGRGSLQTVARDRLPDAEVAERHVEPGAPR